MNNKSTINLHVKYVHNPDNRTTTIRCINQFDTTRISFLSSWFWIEWGLVQYEPYVITNIHRHRVRVGVGGWHEPIDGVNIHNSGW